MNSFLPDTFAEHIERLALGLEPIDALRGLRIAHRIEVALDGAPYPAAELSWTGLMGIADAIGALRRVPRHDSCLHVLLYRAGLKSPVKLRMFDRARRFVARRLGYPIPPDIATPSPRVRRPALYPGAAYDISQTATGMRGRVTWRQPEMNEIPARWVRVEARVGAQVVGRAHGDDRGEFLLILNRLAGGLGTLPSPLIAQVTVFGPPAPVPIPAGDPLGDLPLETLAADPDDISAGEKLPPAYVSTALSTRPITFEPGSILTNQSKFFFSL